MKKADIDEKVQEQKSDADALKLKDAAEPEQKEAEEKVEEKKAEEDMEEEGMCEEEEEKAEEEPSVQEAIANINQRLSRIEETLDSILEEEEAEGSTDAALGKAEQKPGAGGSETESVSEPEQREQPIARLSKELAELKAQFSKFQKTGIKRTVQSGNTQPEESEEMRYVKNLLG